MAFLQPGGMAGQRGNSARTGAGSNKGPVYLRCPTWATCKQPQRWPACERRPPPRPGPAGHQRHQGLGQRGASRPAGVTAAAWPPAPQREPWLRVPLFREGRICTTAFWRPPIAQRDCARAGTEGCQQERCTGPPRSAQAAMRLGEGKGDGFWREKHLWPLPHAPRGDRALPDHVPQPGGLAAL